MINWPYEAWMLNSLLIFFNERNMINTKGYKMEYYAKLNFHINGKSIDISRFNDSVVKARDHKIKKPAFISTLATVEEKYMNYL